MPLYDYDCAACGRRFETIHGLYDDPPAVCPLCGSGPVRKTIGAPAVHYKGSGWAKKERRVKPATTGSSATEGGEGSSDSSSGGAASTTNDAKTPTPKTDSSESTGSSGSTTPSSTTSPD